MNQFSQSRDAKEFLIARIVREAQIEGVPLSEIERKMLYFSETHWDTSGHLERERRVRTRVQQR